MINWIERIYSEDYRYHRAVKDAINRSPRLKLVHETRQALNLIFPEKKVDKQKE